VQCRPAGAVNAGLWEFPNVEVGVNTKKLQPLVAPFLLAHRAPFIRIRHSITRYRILLEAYRAELPGGPATSKAAAVWKTPGELEKLAFTSAHRKVLHDVRGAHAPPKPGHRCHRPRLDGPSTKGVR
jgi:adenine-specific DNA glycosylase